VSEEQIPHVTDSSMSVCLSRFFLRDRQPAWPGSLLRNNGTGDPIVGTHCATMTSDHISIRITFGVTMVSDNIGATMTFVMRREEHIWNVNVLSKEYNFPILFLVFTTVKLSMLVFWVVTLKMETACFFKTLVSTYKSTRRCCREDQHRQSVGGSRTVRRCAQS
jgi:hypothetical protein